MCLPHKFLSTLLGATLLLSMGRSTSASVQVMSGPQINSEWTLTNSEGAAIGTAPQPALDDEADLPAGVSQEWWESVQAMIRREMYFIAPAITPVASYVALNLDANLKIHFPVDGGFWVTSAPPPGRNDPIAVDPVAVDWQWGLRPTSLEIGPVLYELGQPHPAIVADNRLDQLYTLPDGLSSMTEWFVNSDGELCRRGALDLSTAGGMVERSPQSQGDRFTRRPPGLDV
jgi:hypothetical protein